MTHDNDMIRRGDATKAVGEYLADVGIELEIWDIDQIIAALPAAPVSVRVKPLVWQEHRDYGLHEAPSPLGWWYNIHETSGSRFEYQGDPAAGREGNPKMFTTIEAAKAAAQADYAARIMAALDVQPAPDVAQIETPPDDMAGKVAALIDYVLQDDLHNRLTPRVVDIAYSAFMSGRSGKNKDDGGPCDWFNDTKPMVGEQIAKIRAALTAMKGE